MGWRKKAIAQATEVVIQRLEERRMLSVSMEDGIWYVEADDDKNHVITIDVNPRNDQKIRALIDGKVVGSVAIDDIDWVEIYGGGGDDVISTLAGPDVALGGYGGKGNDTMNGGGGLGGMLGGEGNGLVLGGGGEVFSVGGAWRGDNTR